MSSSAFHGKQASLSQEIVVVAVVVVYLHHQDMIYLWSGWASKWVLEYPTGSNFVTINSTSGSSSISSTSRNDVFV